MLRREDATSSWLLRDDRRVALLTRPPRRQARTPDTVLRPLSPVRHETTDALDAVMAQAFAVAFGMGDTTGTARFRPERHTGSEGEPVATDLAWDRPCSATSATAGRTTSPVGATAGVRTAATEGTPAAVTVAGTAVVAGATEGASGALRASRPLLSHRADRDQYRRQRPGRQQLVPGVGLPQH
ncbi:hypothetical protein [[Kitasatospora] papulosa]|uniref:hypothetical protein n=1 Tax=[Kitasatospora] papulosa TaxID=1464011 RepID=UPI003817073B